jgi:hypothetical protein
MSAFYSGSSTISTIDYNGPHTIVSTTAPSMNYSINLQHIPIQALPVHVSGEIVVKHDSSLDKDKGEGS